MISYAQNMEDVLIARFFEGDPPQIFVDVGAAHPVYHSVSKHFSDAGWHGLNIEPRTHLWKLLRSERTRDWNVQCGVSDQAGEFTFYEMTDPNFGGTDAGGLSTFDAQQAALYQQQGLIVEEKKLLVHPLSRLLAVRNIREIGFLKVDVEGFEFQVIKSLDWKTWRPRLVVTECTTPKTNVVRDEDVCSYLAEQGYLAVFFDGLNRYFVRKEDADRADRIRVPANVTDGFMLAEEFGLRQKVHEQQLELDARLVDRKRDAELLEELQRENQQLRAELQASDKNRVAPGNDKQMSEQCEGNAADSDAALRRVA